MNVAQWQGPLVFRAHKVPVSVVLAVARLTAAAVDYLPSDRAEELARAVSNVLWLARESGIAEDALDTAREAVEHRRQHAAVYGWPALSDEAAAKLAGALAAAWGDW